MSQKLPAGSFEWVENASELNTTLKKTTMQIAMEDIFLNFKISILKNYMNFTMTYPFYLNEWKLKKIEEFVGYLHDKKEYVKHIRNLRQALNHELVF